MTGVSIPRSWLVVMAAALFVLPGVATAHEAHKKDMTDAEMSELEMQGEHAMHTDSGHDKHGPAAMKQAHPAAAAAAVPATAEQLLQARIAANRATSVNDFIGRLHPVAAHFPIALFLFAAFAELLLMLRPALGMERTVRFLVAGGAAGAVAAAVLGWFAAGWRLLDRSETLGIHRWNGTAIALLAIVAAWFAYRSRSRTGLRLLLAILVVAISIQGYLGGEMVFGPNHLGLE